MMRNHGATALLLAVLLLSGCGETEVRETTPAEAYRAFFTELAAGNTQDALEGLAPDGALGSTFTGGSYYMLANEFEARIDYNGSVDEIIIDREEAYSDDEVMVDGRIVFRDGSEMARAIRFTREGERWVGHI